MNRKAKNSKDLSSGDALKKNNLRYQSSKNNSLKEDLKLPTALDVFASDLLDLLVIFLTYTFCYNIEFMRNKYLLLIVVLFFPPILHVFQLRLFNKSLGMRLVKLTYRGDKGIFSIFRAYLLGLGLWIYPYILTYAILSSYKLSMIEVVLISTILYLGGSILYLFYNISPIVYPTKSIRTPYKSEIKKSRNFLNTFIPICFYFLGVLSLFTLLIYNF